MIAEAKKRNSDLDFASGEDLQNDIKEVVAQDAAFDRHPSERAQVDPIERTSYGRRRIARRRFLHQRSTGSAFDRNADEIAPFRP